MILNRLSDDESIDIVVEVMGGLEPAYTFVKRSLEAGKNVVTSNKALVAAHGVGAFTDSEGASCELPV